MRSINRCRNRCRGITAAFVRGRGTSPATPIGSGRRVGSFVTAIVGNEASEMDFCRRMLVYEFVAACLCDCFSIVGQTCCLKP